MKAVTQIVHTLVKILRAEEVFVKLSRIHPAFRKFIPLPADYSKTSYRKILRDGTLFNVNLSDYMQWHLFADIPDNAVNLAIIHLKPQAIVLDIGANCGNFALKLGTYIVKKEISDLQIHAFEPNPWIYDRLQQNIKLNPGLDNVVLTHKLAVGSNNEIRGFNFQMENSGSGRIAESEINSAAEVTIKRLDDIIDTLAPTNINFVKLDVEGFEPEVFRGAWKALLKYKPVLFFEVTPLWYKERGFFRT